jgi:uncharacterized membrane protein (DUF2068 family)
MTHDKKPAFEQLEPKTFGERRFLSGLVRARRPDVAWILAAVAVMFAVLYLVKGWGEIRLLLLCALHAYLAFTIYVRHCGYKLLRRSLDENADGEA